MPDHGPGREADGAAVLLDAPAHVDVVAGGPVARVVAADGPQRLGPIGRVAAGHVLGDGVADEHVVRSARCQRHEVRHLAVAGRRQVRPACPIDAVLHVRPGDVAQPVRVGIGVVVDVGGDLAGRLAHALVAGSRQALVLLAREPDVVARGDGRGVVGRAIVDDDDLVVGVVLDRQPVEAVADELRAVVAAADHGDAGPLEIVAGTAPRRRPPTARPGPAWARAPAWSGRSPSPRRPRRCGPTRRSRRTRTSPEPPAAKAARTCVETRCAWNSAPLRMAVRPQLGDDHGPVGREVLQPGHVALEVLVVLQVHVPRVVVDAADAQVLGGGVVDVRHERTRVGRVDRRRPDAPGRPPPRALRASARCARGSRCRC